MNLLYISSIANVEGNGVAIAVKNYLKFMSVKANIAIYNLESNIEINENVKSFNIHDYQNISSLPNEFSKPDLVIFNEVYKPKYIKLYKECLKKNIKYIIIPHGCLVSKSQKKHWIKKFLGNTFLFNKFIKNATAIQFLNDREKRNSHFVYKKAIIAGNGVYKLNCTNSFKDGDKKNIVFIGRYNYKIKGLDLICEICRKHREWFEKNNVCINLYGRDTLNNLKTLEKKIQHKEISNILKVNGPVYGDEKGKILSTAYAFIQCSRHEGQPMGILEALSIGTPCIVTYGTSLGEYINNTNCGFGCEFNNDKVFFAIKKLCENPKMRDVFSKNAKINSLTDFSWEKVIDKTYKEYLKIV